jgi:hypothetical protein
MFTVACGSKSPNFHYVGDRMLGPCELYRIWVDGENDEKHKEFVELGRHWHLILKRGCA